jgi:hypothetical protein
MKIKRLGLIGNKLIALFILKLTYSIWAKIITCLSGLACLLIFIKNLDFMYFILFILLCGLCGAVLLMKPYDNIIVISRITGSPHVLIKNREVIARCFEGDKLNSMLLLNEIKKSIYKYMYECARNSKRRSITTVTHKILFITLGLHKLNFITDIKEIKGQALRDKLIFISFKELFKTNNLNELSRKVPYYKFTIDMKLLREYVDKNPEKDNKAE